MIASILKDYTHKTWEVWQENHVMYNQILISAKVKGELNYSFRWSLPRGSTKGLVSVSEFENFLKPYLREWTLVFYNKSSLKECWS